MTSILLTGIPGTGKSVAVEGARKLSERVYPPGGVMAVSLGDIVAEEAYRLWMTTSERRPYIGFAHQQALRSYAIAEAARRLESSEEPHSIVETPMSMFLRGTIPNMIFETPQIRKLHVAAGGFQYAVTLIDDEQRIAEKLKEPYPKDDPEKVLDWLAFEVDVTRAASSSCLDGEKSVRNLVISTEYSAETLAKLLNDPKPPVGYLGFPITHLKGKEGDTTEDTAKKEQARKRIRDFQERWQNYSVVITPIEMSDSPAEGIKGKDSIVHRDEHWFLRGSDYMLAFFPDETFSLGVAAEMTHTSETGKPVILVHPKSSYKNEAFGVQPTIYARDEEEFFRMIESGSHDFLGQFLGGDGKPRYARMRDLRDGATQ